MFTFKRLSTFLSLMALTFLVFYSGPAGVAVAVNIDFKKGGSSDPDTYNINEHVFENNDTYIKNDAIHISEQDLNSGDDDIYENSIAIIDNIDEDISDETHVASDPVSLVTLYSTSLSSHHGSNNEQRYYYQPHGKSRTKRVVRRPFSRSRIVSHSVSKSSRYSFQRVPSSIGSGGPGHYTDLQQTNHSGIWGTIVASIMFVNNSLFKARQLVHSHPMVTAATILLIGLSLVVLNGMGKRKVN